MSTRARIHTLAVILLFTASWTSTADISKQVTALFNKLGHDSWKVREAAQEELVKLGQQHHEVILGAGIEVIADSDDPEVDYRVKGVLRRLVVTYTFRKQKGYLGVRLQQEPVPLDRDGREIYPVRIAQLLPDTPATTSGLIAGDRIIKADDQVCDQLFDINALVDYISGKPPRTRMTFVILRGSKTLTKSAILAERPKMTGDPPIELQKEEYFRKWYHRSLKRARATRTP